MLDAQALIGKHRGKGVIVDSNLLVLLLVGSVNTSRILNCKRTGDFTIADFNLLRNLITWFGKVFSTPHVLSQVSDLAEINGDEQRILRHLFRLVVDEVEEHYESSRELVADPIFVALGLADSAIANVACSGILALTADVTLQLALQRRGAGALNFNHVRQLAWNGSA
ncbi:MAG: hypothetical protein M3Z32_01320 [Acidobacteriota bacterium]|nr:hypothetical protein [Acidobacteriota bacterium]